MKATKAKKSSKPAGLGDDRFAHLKSDPKFSGLNNLNKKVVIEKRFAAALTDEKFSSRARVDKRGRRMKKTVGNDLVDLYELEKDEDDDVEIEEPSQKKVKQGEKNDDDSDVEEEGPLKVDLARGEGNLSSSDDSDSGEESDWELPGDVRMEMDVAHLDNDAERVEWASRRLAACNLDWDMVKAEDILILVNSFRPTGGSVEKISIYLSDFGQERLEEEEKHGPRLQLSKPLEEYQNDDGLDPDTKLAIRKYQLDRLKYYYAVIECDSEQTASAIYEQCDGFQFESSGLKMDLRFVPDEMEFEEDRLKECVSESDVNLGKYRSKEKMKSGVTVTNSKLAWDEGDEFRAQKFHNAFSNPEDESNDLIAASDSEDDEAVANRRSALLSLLGDQREGDGLEIDWGAGETNEAEEESEGEGESDDDSDIEKALARRNKETEESDGEEQVEEEDAAKVEKKTGYKTYLEKKKAKKRERKEKLREARAAEKEMLQETEQGTKKKLKQAKLKKTVKSDKSDDTAEGVVADDRFKALFTDSSFAIEQSTKHFKGSKLIGKQVEVRKTTRQEPSAEDDLLAKLKTKSQKWNKKTKKSC